MTKARDIIKNSLSFGLNRLSPGETMDADLSALCLDALNDIVDEFNGAKLQLFREILTAGVVTGATGTLGTNWPSLVPGDLVLGASVSYSVGLDTPMQPITLATYQAIPQKATGGLPQWFAPDGAALIYFWPAATGQTITLRTRQVFTDFADLDTDYVMPKGYKSAFSALLSEKMAPTMLGGIPAAITRAAGMARVRLNSMNVDPAIIRSGVRTGNILTGWNA
jgi:hypothetical protein